MCTRRGNVAVRPILCPVLAQVLLAAWAVPVVHAQIGVMASVVGGVGGNGTSRIPPGGAVSTYGQHLVFVSGASDLVPGDTNNADDVFAVDLKTGVVTRMSVSASGGQGNAGGGFGQFGPMMTGAAVSRDGRFVVYPSASSDLVAGDTNGWTDVFRHDRDTNANGVFDEPGSIATTLVTVSSSGAQGNWYSHGPSVSADGRFVCFISHASNLVPNDTNSVDDVFVRDVQTGQTRRVNVSSSGAQADAATMAAMISADGRYVAFDSGATNLVTGDGNGLPDVFLHDLQTGQTTRLSVDTAGGDPNGSSGGAVISRDGRHVGYFSAASDLVAGDSNGFQDVFVHDTQTGSTALVSVSTTGALGNDDSWHCTVSDTGRVVAFVTEATNLGAGSPWMAFLHDRDADGNGVFDEPGGIATTIASRLPAGSIPSSVPVGWPGAPWIALSGTGEAVAFTHCCNGQAYAFMQEAVDSDGDSLLDAWEILWVDANTDGTIDLFLPAPTNPAHKDLIVEVDSMQVSANQGRLPTQPTLNSIVQVFAAAPNALVNNPDGLPGVRLHLLVDETNIPLLAFDGSNLNNPSASAWPLPVPANPPQNTFCWHRNTYKGTPAQRANPNWANIRAAILMTQRYCLFADQIGATGIGGLAEEPGNDFFVSLGGWPGQTTAALTTYTSIGGSPAEQVGVFIHELGHNLGLMHGGNQFDPAPGQQYNDRYNWKPNYFSVMNYTHTFPRGQIAGSWNGDYSRFQSPALNEANLNEPAGIGGQAGLWTLSGPPGTAQHTVPNPPPSVPACGWTWGVPMPYAVPQVGGVDWNKNCNTAGTGVVENINGLAIAIINGVRTWVNPGWPGDLLTGFNDWINVRWQIGGNAWFLDNPPDGVVPETGLTYDLIKGLDAMGWSDRFDTYTAGAGMNIRGGWEAWCQGGDDATVVGAPFFSPPNALRIAFPAGPGPFGSDIVKPFAIDSGRWGLTMRTFVPSGAGGKGYVIMLNQYCSPESNWSLQVMFDEPAGTVRSDLDGHTLPLIKDQWVEFRVEIDLENDRFTEYYGGEVLAEDLVWTMNVSGQLGTPGITSIAALDLFSEGIAEMYFDDISLLPEEACYPDCNGNSLLTVADFGCFQAKFASGDPYADCNQSTTLTIADFGCFQSKFAQGCP